MHIPDQESRGHISPTKQYFVIGALLLVLTVITVAVAQKDWGKLILDSDSMALNVIIAMLIATVKAGLVLTYFMHMKYENKLIWGFGIIYPLVLFAILMFFTVVDVSQRLRPELGADNKPLPQLIK